MKYRTIAVILICLIFCGCNQNTDSTVTSSIITTTENVDFMGISKGDDLQFGNSISCLNMGGLICYMQESMIFGSSNGDIKIKTGASEKVLSKNVYPQCINVLNETVYFIDTSNNNSICSVDLNGDNYRQIMNESALFLMMSEESMIYQNSQKELFISTNGNVQTITDKEAVWINSYGEWLIYAEFKSDCAVKAYNVITGEYVRILDYGFYPTVFKDYLFYQEHDHGHICRMNLITGEKSIFLEEWGQQFCFIDNNLYFTSSHGINKFKMEKDIQFTEIYRPDNEKNIIDRLFVCNDELFFSEKAENKSVLFRINMVTGEKEEVK